MLQSLAFAAPFLHTSCALDVPNCTYIIFVQIEFSEFQVQGNLELEENCASVCVQVKVWELQVQENLELDANCPSICV